MLNLDTFICPGPRDGIEDVEDVELFESEMPCTSDDVITFLVGTWSKSLKFLCKVVKYFTLKVINTYLQLTDLSPDPLKQKTPRQCTTVVPTVVCGRSFGCQVSDVLHAQEDKS